MTERVNDLYASLIKFGNGGDAQDVSVFSVGELRSAKHRLERHSRETSGEASRAGLVADALDVYIQANISTLKR